MSIVSWTDSPLVSGSKTYSVYITEIQHNCNERQKDASLGVTQWLNASPAEKFKFEHMEQIKKALEDPFLLQFYGYASIRDILGRPWSAYAENVRTHQKLASFQIINDMRRVIDSLFSWFEKWDSAVIGTYEHGDTILADDGGDSWDVEMAVGGPSSVEVTADRQLRMEILDPSQNNYAWLWKEYLPIPVSRGTNLRFRGKAWNIQYGGYERCIEVQIWVGNHEIRYFWGGTENEVISNVGLYLGAFDSERHISRNLVNDIEMVYGLDAVGWEVNEIFFLAQVHSSYSGTMWGWIDDIRI